MKYVYKIVAALGALATIPLIIFSELFYFRIASVALQTLMSFGQLLNIGSINALLQENGGKIPEGISDTLSFYDIYSLLGNSLGSGEIDSASALNHLIGPVLVFLTIAIIVAVCAVVTAVLAFAAKDNRKVIYSSIVGIGFSVMLSPAFEAIAAPILSGEANIAAIVDSWWASLIGNIEKLDLTTNVWFIPAIFVAIIIWTVIYNYTLPEKEKKERLLMIGEAEE